MSNRKTEVVCPLIFANRIIGGKWKMRILWHIIHGENRFGILKKVYTGNFGKGALYQSPGTGGRGNFA